MAGDTEKDKQHSGQYGQGSQQSGQPGQHGQGQKLSLIHIYDSWVVGDEPYVSLHFLGAELYAQQKK